MQPSWVERGLREWRGRPARLLRSRAATPALIGLAVVLMLGAGLAALRSSSPETADPSPMPRHATERHLNPRAGYEFRHPRGWTVRDRGSVSQVTSPGGEVTVSFGLGAAGSLNDASGGLVSEILDGYAGARAHGAEVTTMAGVPAVSVSGSAVNEEQVPIRFLAVTLASSDRNYSIVVFSASDADPADVAPRVQEMLDSFSAPRADPTP